MEVSVQGLKLHGMGFISILELNSEMSSANQSPQALLILSEEKRLSAIHLAFLSIHPLRA